MLTTIYICLTLSIVCFIAGMIVSIKSLREQNKAAEREEQRIKKMYEGKYMTRVNKGILEISRKN